MMKAIERKDMPCMSEEDLFLTFCLGVLTLAVLVIACFMFYVIEEALEVKEKLNNSTEDTKEQHQKREKALQMKEYSVDSFSYTSDSVLAIIMLRLLHSPDPTRLLCWEFEHLHTTVQGLAIQDLLGGT